MEQKEIYSNNIRIDSADNDLESLVIQINLLYDLNAETKIQSKLEQKELKKNISNISHDFRTPLTSISGYLQLIQDSSLSEDEKKRYIEIIKKGTKNLEELVSNFYDLSRIQSNDYLFYLEPVDLKYILSENIAIFYDEFVKYNIVPKIDIQEKIPSIISDKSAITRIFSNLLSNMLKYSKNEIEIVLKNCEEYVITSFSNKTDDLNGADVSSMFERLYTTNKFEYSSGIGLSLTKSLVEKLGNLIDAKYYSGKLTIEIRWMKIENNIK